MRSSYSGGNGTSRKPRSSQPTKQPQTGDGLHRQLNMGDRMVHVVAKSSGSVRAGWWRRSQRKYIACAADQVSVLKLRTILVVSLLSDGLLLRRFTLAASEMRHRSGPTGQISRAFCELDQDHF